MARKQAKGGKPPEPPPRKKNLVVIRGYETWGKWLVRYAESKGMPVTVLLEHLARESAKKDRFEPPPKRY